MSATAQAVVNTIMDTWVAANTANRAPSVALLVERPNREEWRNADIVDVLESVEVDDQVGKKHTKIGITVFVELKTALSDAQLTLMMDEFRRLMEANRILPGGPFHLADITGGVYLSDKRLKLHRRQYTINMKEVFHNL